MVYSGQNYSAAVAAEVGIEDIEGIEGIEENMVTIVVEVVEETGSRGGISSIQETTTWVDVVAVSKDSMSYSFALSVGKSSTKYNLKGIVYSHFACYCSNFPYYSKMETSLKAYLDFDAAMVSSVQ